MLKKQETYQQTVMPFDLGAAFDAMLEEEEVIEEENLLPSYEESLVEASPHEPVISGTSLTDLTNALIAGAISEDDWTEKAAAVAAYIRKEKAMVDAIKVEKKNLDDRMRTHQGNADRLIDYLKVNMDAVGKRRFETGNVRVSTRTTKVLEVEDEDKLRNEYPEFFEERVSFKLDKTSLKKSMQQDGISSDYAHMSSKTSLIIK